jgi:cell wall-associated NlpC family hydrolase
MNSAAHVDNDINNWKTIGMSKAEMAVLIAEDCIGWPYVYGERGATCTPAKRRSRANDLDGNMPAEAAAIRKGCQVLKGSAGSCSGCRYYPGGAKTRCFDCRGFTYWVLLQCGITINGVGATSQWNTDANWKAKGRIEDMPVGQVCCVFMHNSTTGKMDHTGLYVGGGRIIHCSGEVKVGKISDKGWTHFAVPMGMEGEFNAGLTGASAAVVTKPTLRKGASGAFVVECQEDLLKLGYDLAHYGADGKYGNITMREVRKFQAAQGLVVDGICGPMTWAALDAAIGANG